MAGNSGRRGAVRRAGTKKGQVKGSGGKGRRALQGRGATPKAQDRHWYADKQQRVARKRQVGQRRRNVNVRDLPEMVLGRNPVLECLRAEVPATALYIAQGTSNDDRLTEAINTAKTLGLPIQEVSRKELDRLSENGMHQGIALEIPPYEYADPAELIDIAREKGEAPLIVVLDNITDPRNLGATVRSTAAFGGHGVVIPERRSASMTAVAWRTSAGTAARLPVARATNLTRTVQAFAKAGCQIVGLDAGGDASLDTYDGTGPVVVVVGSEGKGISRLVSENCDSIMSIPMASNVESLNASVACGVVLSEFARQRRQQTPTS